MSIPFVGGTITKYHSLSYLLVYPYPFPVLRCPYPSTRHVLPAFKHLYDPKHSVDAELLVLCPIVGRNSPWQESQVSITNNGNFFIFCEAYFFHRAVTDTVALAKYTPNLISAILNETVVRFSLLKNDASKDNANMTRKLFKQFWATRLGPNLASGFVIHSITLWVSSYLSHDSASSAYPADRTYGFSPSLIWFVWEDPAQDAVFHSAVKQSAEQIRQVALREGQDVGKKFPSLAVYDTPLEDIYGGNVPRLQALKQRVDPTNVMGLAGGFKF